MGDMTNSGKKSLRAEMRALRDGLGADERARADAHIAEGVFAHPAYAAADAVFTYLSVGTEVDTRPIIRRAWEQGKLVAVPRCIAGTNRMEWYRLDDFEGLEAGAFGIEEPPADARRLVSVPASADDVRAVALVPGYSFDAQGFRLGYGGGFYDVFLPAFAGVSLGLCRSVQFSERPLPHDAHDIAVDEVICG